MLFFKKGLYWRDQSPPTAVIKDRETKEVARMDPTEALFEQVYEAYGPSLYRFCLLQMKNPADAEDVLQDVLIKRLYQAPRFKSPEHERNWLFQVALNLCRDEWRRHRRSELPLEAAAGVALGNRPIL